LSWTLGIWDGHDAGAALLRDGELAFAINEERLTRRKLEIGFPARSIRAALAHAAITPAEVTEVAACTGDFARTLSRWIPSLQERYYQIRRRKASPSSWALLTRRLKHRITALGPDPVSRVASLAILRGRLRAEGLGHTRLHLVGHHDAHAAAAARFSGLTDALVISLDGVGDGLSGSIRVMDGRELRPVAAIPGDASFGLFFEHVTHLLNLRELEDEGKVMALASCTWPVPDSENPMLELLKVDGLRVSARHSGTRLLDALSRILWRSSSEQFAFMAQRTLEIRVGELVANAVRATGRRRIALAGGVASNVKLNLMLRELPGVEELFVFPHMGDGGLAAGAAAWVSDGVRQNTLPLRDAFLGPSFDDDRIARSVRDAGFVPEVPSAGLVARAAELLERGEVIGWFQGRMEYGPRSLGARSILARPDSTELRDRLNLQLKRRSWYQPFCPSMLEEEASRLLIGVARPDPFMTTACRVRPEARSALAGVIAPDGTCRPQMVSSAGDLSDARHRFAALLVEMRGRTGQGVLLNTSFNVHGEPIVCSPEDALRAFGSSALRHLAIGPFLVSKRDD